MERIKINAAHFLTNTKIRNHKGVINKLLLSPLVQRKKTREVSRFLKILTKEDQHPALSSAYEDLLTQPTTITVPVQTRAQARRQPWSVGASGTTRYMNSFLLRTVRDLKIRHNQDHSS